MPGTRRAFRLTSPNRGAQTTCFMHILTAACKKNGHRLAADPEVARDCESLKRKLTAKFEFESRAYKERKTDFIRNEVLKARAEDGESLDATLPR